MSARNRNTRALSSTILASTVFQSEMIYYTTKYQQKNNFVISPISIRSLLTLISIGVIKGTHHELISVMGLKSPHHGTNEYKACRNMSRDEFTFQIHNAIFMNARYDFAISFRTICLEQFQTRIQSIDFEHPAEAATNMNTWISEQTGDSIATRITPNTLRPSQDNLLINIARLDYKWVKPFPKKLLTQENFWLSASKKIQVTLMHDFVEVLHGDLEDLKATAVFLPYKNVNVGLLILLPHAKEGLVNMEAHMLNRRLDLTAVPMALKMKSVKIGLPKLRLECEIEMEQVLRDMGIKEIFNESMDFARLLDSLAIMKIAQIKHIASIEINEDGTTSPPARVSFLLTQLKDYVTVEVNHPFFFAVMDQERIYFGGHINDESNFI